MMMVLCPVPEEQLPVMLPKNVNLDGEGNPLTKMTNGKISFVLLLVKMLSEKQIHSILSLSPHGIT